MSKITVLAPGMLTAVHDAGRPQFQQSGIGVTGVMDYYSQSCANILVGNPMEEAVLEATLLGPTLQFEGDMVVAVTGAYSQCQLNGEPMPMWQSVRVKTGDTLSLPMVQKGCRLYIAFAGGIDVPVVMGSKSTDVKAKIGGLDGRVLRKGDELKLNALGVDIQSLPLCRVPQEYIMPLNTEIELRAVLGPQDAAFTEEGINTFFTGKYTIMQDSDRMGYRLEGEAITHIKGSDIISDGIVAGAVQVPGSGKPIILLADRQTAGGYTKIATVITADLPKLGQARPGDVLHFKQVSVQEAQSCLREMKDKLNQLNARLMPPAKQYNVVVNGNPYHVIVEEVI